MNCHGPRALARESALVLKPLSMSGSQESSSGSPASLRALKMAGAVLSRTPVGSEEEFSFLSLEQVKRSFYMVVHYQWDGLVYSRSQR